MIEASATEELINPAADPFSSLFFISSLIEPTYRINTHTKSCKSPDYRKTDRVARKNLDKKCY
jgi:hypothetical protein